MARILCLVLPLKSHLHLHAKLAKDLEALGHTVVFAAMADAKPMIEEYGFECHTLFARHLPEGLMGQWLVGEIQRNTLGAKLRFYLAERRKMIDHEKFVEFLIQGGYREFVQSVQQVDPSLILIDNGLHTYWALMAHATGVQCVYTSSHLPLVEDEVTPPVSSMLVPAHDAASRAEVKRTWEQHFQQRQRRSLALRLAGIPDSFVNFRRLARATGCPAEAYNERALLFPQLNIPLIVFCPEEFDFPEARKRSAVYYGDALMNVDRSENRFAFDQLSPEKKLIFCSLGSMAIVPPFFQAVLDSVAEEPGWQLVINVGPTLRPADFARVPTNAILANGAPQLSLLRRAAAMINHGGINSVRECLYFGVPQLVVPLFFDQPGSAARVQYHRVGAVGNVQMPGTEIRKKLQTLVSDEETRARCRRMADVFQQREQGRASARVAAKFTEARAVRSS